MAIETIENASNKIMNNFFKVNINGSVNLNSTKTSVGWCEIKYIMPGGGHKTKRYTNANFGLRRKYPVSLDEDGKKSLGIISLADNWVSANKIGRGDETFAYLGDDVLYSLSDFEKIIKCK